MALTKRSKEVFAIALCADKALTAEIIAKVQTPAVLSNRAKRVMNIMLPDKAVYAEVIAAIASGGPLTLTAKAKLMLRNAICDGIAARNVIAEIES